MSSKKFPDFEFIELDTRKKLAEGRDYGVGFTHAKRKDTQLVAIQALSPCRDYINDVIYSEVTGKTYSAHGQDSKREGIFEDGNSYLIFGVCKRGRELYEYDGYKRDYDSLAANYKTLQKFINYFEKSFNIKQKSVILKLKENRYVCISSLFWADATYKASLLSFLLRVGIYYEAGNPMEYLDNFSQNDSDKMLYNSFKSKLKLMLGGFFPKQDLNSLTNVHNTGIVTFKFGSEPIQDNLKKEVALHIKPILPANNLQPMKFEIMA